MRILISVFALFFLAFPQAFSQREITILHTNNINAQLENCLCDKHPYGGLEKIGYQIQDIRKRHKNTILFDAGDFFPAYPDSLKIKLLLDIMEYLKYDAIGLGDQEFLLGGQYLANQFNKRKLPLLASNIEINGKSVFPKKLSLKKNGVIFTVYSLISPAAFDFYPPEITNNIKIIDPVKFLTKELPESGKKNSVIILLSHLAENQEKEIAEKFPPIDLIVSGHSQITTPEPLKIGNAFMVEAGGEGYYLGKMTINVDNNYKIPIKEYNLIKMKLELPNDPIIVSFAKQYDFHFIKNAVANMSNFHPIENNYLVKEAGACAEKCHAEQFTNWKKGTHANAWKSLEKENKTKIPECMTCHSTGYGRRDGFFNINLTPKLTGVACTECHLTNKEHESLKNRSTVKKITKSTCIRCHDEKNDPDFNYEKDKKMLNY